MATLRSVRSFIKKKKKLTNKTESKCKGEKRSGSDEKTESLR